MLSSPGLNIYCILTINYIILLSYKKLTNKIEYKNKRIKDE